jgi:hypothetical protein
MEWRMKLKIKDKSKVVFGNVEVPDDLWDPKNVKERVTCFIDMDVVDWLRASAKEIGIGYQTLLNMKLRELKDGGEAKLDETNLAARLARLEKLVKSPTARYSAEAPKHRGTRKVRR